MTFDDELKTRVESQFPNIVEQLKTLIRIPSVSSDSFDQAPVAQSAEQVRAFFAELGGETSIRSCPGENGWEGRPAVIAKFPATSVKPEAAPTVLLYAHHDVQPGGDPEKWTVTTPFEPVEKDGRLYGRGSSDDGAGIAVHLGSISALGNDRNVNIVVFIEGEEEVGSPSFNNFLEENREDLKANLIVVTDSDNWKAGHPAITTTLRGVAQVTVELQVLDHALHSGMFGGPILDAVTLSSRLIATLHDEDGSVAVEGLVSRETADVDYPEADFRNDTGLLDGVQLAGRGALASRLWTQPAISIIGMDTTSVANASNTIIPSCRFVVSMRVAPGQDANEARQKLTEHLIKHTPFGAKIEISDGEAGPAYQAEDNQYLATLRECLAASWGREPVDIGVGGSIPFIADFQRAFPEAAVVVTGVEDPLTNAHSEDESQDLDDLQKAILAEALLLNKVGNGVNN
ncbi:dipeptidase [Boudabousia liubingyangii]|nr:dipeptidase [Boudabousia liubingyangii]